MKSKVTTSVTRIERIELSLEEVEDLINEKYKGEIRWNGDIPNSVEITKKTTDFLIGG